MFPRRYLANDVFQTRFRRDGAAHNTLCLMCWAVVRKWPSGAWRIKRHLARWLESLHKPGNMSTSRQSCVTYTGCRSLRASTIRLQCLLISSCPLMHRLICRKSSRFIILHDSCVLLLTAHSLSRTSEHSSVQGLFDTLHRQYGTAFLLRSPLRHRLCLHSNVT